MILFNLTKKEFLMNNYLVLKNNIPTSYMLFAPNAEVGLRHFRRTHKFLFANKNLVTLHNMKNPLPNSALKDTSS